MVVTPLEERVRALAEVKAEGERTFARIEARESAKSVAIDQARRDAQCRKGRAPPEELRLTAFHEAGHAVVSARAGVGVFGCAVFDGGGGVTWTERSESNDAGHLAGAIAERFAGRPDARPSAADLGLMRGGLRENILAGFEAEEILAKEWRRVERLAEELLALGFVPGDVVHQVAGAPPGG